MNILPQDGVNNEFIKKYPTLGRRTEYELMKILLQDGVNNEFIKKYPTLGWIKKMNELINILSQDKVKNE